MVNVQRIGGIWGQEDIDSYRQVEGLFLDDIYGRIPSTDPESRYDHLFGSIQIDDRQKQMLAYVEAEIGPVGSLNLLELWTVGRGPALTEKSTRTWVAAVKSGQPSHVAVPILNSPKIPARFLEQVLTELDV